MTYYQHNTLDNPDSQNPKSMRIVVFSCESDKYYTTWFIFHLHQYDPASLGEQKLFVMLFNIYSIVRLAVFV